MFTNIRFTLESVNFAVKSNELYKHDLGTNF